MVLQSVYGGEDFLQYLRAHDHGGLVECAVDVAEHR